MKNMFISLMLMFIFTVSTSSIKDTLFFKTTTNSSVANVCNHSGWFQAGCSSQNTICKVGIHTYYCWSQDGNNWCCEYECGCN